MALSACILTVTLPGMEIYYTFMLFFSGFEWSLHGNNKITSIIKPMSEWLLPLKKSKVRPRQKLEE